MEKEQQIEKQKRGSGFYFLAAILLVLLIVCGVFYYKTYKEQSKELEEITDWEIFRNNGDGYEIKYPSTWEAPYKEYYGEEIPPGELCGLESPDLPDCPFGRCPYPMKGAKVLIHVYRFKKKTYKDWQTQIKEEFLLPGPLTTMEINNREYLKWEDEPGKNYSINVWCANDVGTKIADIYLLCARANKEYYINIFQQMLTTLKF